MRILKLSNGMEAIVDDNDYHVLLKYKWYAVMNGNRNYYAVMYIYMDKEFANLNVL